MNTSSSENPQKNSVVNSGIRRPVSAVRPLASPEHSPNLDTRPLIPKLVSALQILGLSRQSPPKVVVGRKAYVQWWRRLLAFLALVVLLVCIGVILIAVVAVLLLAAGLMFEGAIS